MIIKCEAWINDEAEEYLMNLTAQGFFSEAWETKMKLMIAFEHSLNYIIGTTLNETLKHLNNSKSKIDEGTSKDL